MDNSLSTKIFGKDDWEETPEGFLNAQDVRDAVRRLQTNLGFNVREDNEILVVFQVKKIIEEIFGKELCEDNTYKTYTDPRLEDDNSPSQQTSVDKREIGTTKKISDVGENPILDTQTHPDEICECGHKKYSHGHFNRETRRIDKELVCCHFGDCSCKKFIPRKSKEASA